MRKSAAFLSLALGLAAATAVVEANIGAAAAAAVAAEDGGAGLGGLDGLLQRLLAEQRRQTVLELSERAARDVPEDEQVATLVAHAEAPAPADAQATVNKAMREALDAAQGTAASGTRAATGAYAVSREEREDRPAVWVAEQELTLVGRDAPAMLALIGRLQGAGLAVRDLRWRVAAATRRAVERQLLSEALEALSAKARAAADGLGLRHAGWRRVAVQPPPSAHEPPYGRMAAMSMAKEAAPPPVTAAGSGEVAVTVSAEALLEPASP